MNNAIYFVWLSKIKELNQIDKRTLLEKYKIEELWKLDKSELISILKDENKANALLDEEYKKGLERELELLQKNNIKLITIFDKKYPINLKNIYDYPVVLYAKGNIDILNNLSIAIVGSRSISEYGKKISQMLGYSLSKNNINIISGLAKGVDTNAHIGALKANGCAVAVIGCGIDIIYPIENEKLFNNIIEKGGVVITEYAVGTKPDRMNFPARNRIISGLSDGVVIVEAAKKSGALITVDFALEQGKNVYAIPGNITSPNSLGTNELIKQGAKLVTNVNDILEDYGL